MPRRTAVTSFCYLLLCSFLLILGACSGGSGHSSTSSGTVIVGVSNGGLQIVNTSLQISQGTTATVNFTKADGTPAVGVPVTFSTTLGTLTPATGITTDASGNASVTLTAGTTSGQGQLTATAIIDNRQVTPTALFTVNLPALHLANMRLTNNVTSINFGSSVGVSVDVLDANNRPYTAQPVDVVFNSPFVQQGKSSLNSPVQTVVVTNGGVTTATASTTYTALTATGSDTITASISGSTLSVTFTVTPLNAGSISFVSASPRTIGLRGMGGLGIQETSLLTFKVSDTSGAPKANQPVDFALNTTVGGITLSAGSGSTDQNGQVTTIVHSGIVATPVRVTASTTVGTNTTLSTQSDQLVISTGVPSQDGFSLSLVDSNPEAFNRDGVTVQVTARLSDHFHNPVPDGTAVSFTTSGGSIEPSCFTVKGACSVNWTSQNPRPLVATGAKLDGRAVIMAYAIGEEAFVDLNGNGLADAGEFTDTSEAFRDDNENGRRDPNEPFIDFNGDRTFNLGDTFYNGVLQGTGSTNAAKSKHVFANATLVMSTSAADIKLLNSSNSVTSSVTAPGKYSILVSDLNGNTMPSGTTISVEVPFGTVTGVTNATVPLSTANGSTISFNIAAAGTPVAKTGLLKVTVTSPAGLSTIVTFDVNGLF